MGHKWGTNTKKTHAYTHQLDTQNSSPKPRQKRPTHKRRRRRRRRRRSKMRRRIENRKSGVMFTKFGIICSQLRRKTATMGSNQRSPLPYRMAFCSMDQVGQQFTLILFMECNQRSPLSCRMAFCRIHSAGLQFKPILCMDCNQKFPCHAEWHSAE